jgi:hypothetical protein
MAATISTVQIHGRAVRSALATLSSADGTVSETVSTMPDAIWSQPTCLES